MNKEKWLPILKSLEELFSTLGQNIWDNTKINRFTKSEFDELNNLIVKQHSLNGWFTEENVRKALSELADMIKQQHIIEWLKNYSYAKQPKKILLIMAGNLPLVGFHDLLCVWLSGNKAIIKLSSDDNTLLPKIIELLANLHPEIYNYYTFDKNEIRNVDAVIATGSDNSNLYFEKYFGHLPCLFRKNRTSIAILSGHETKEELELLGKDIFDYFGKGCRNVSFLLISEYFDLNRLFESIVIYGDIINHKKYGNNYDYNRAIYLMNQLNVLDNNFVLLNESDTIFSSISMIHYKRYYNEEEIKHFISTNYESIQIIIGKNYLPFGSSQKPKLSDYADGKDTMSWLNSLS